MLRAEQIWISIHALREEGDLDQFLDGIHISISIHALREEGDFSRFLRGRKCAGISIHALREEGDRGSENNTGGNTYFYPRPPRGGRQFDPELEARLVKISIHALREEGDPHGSAGKRRGNYFYPRPPRGGRQQKQRQNLYFLINYTTFCTNLEEP